jgi:hypothetical protein
MRAFVVRYVLRDRTGGAMTVIAHSTFDAIDVVEDFFGLRLAGISARPAHAFNPGANP